jgi:transposase
MLRFSVPPGYVRTKAPIRPKLDEFTGVIDAILMADKDRPKKQQHTSKRVFGRLRDEHGFTGKITIVKDYIAGWRQRTQEMFVPLVHPPGDAQADFGEASGVIGGVERKIHFFAMDLPNSDAIFVIAYPAETTEAFCDGHVRALAFFEGVPRSILYDNTKIAVARILGDGKRQRTRVFSELQSRYLFTDRFGRPGKGNDGSAPTLALWQILSRFDVGMDAANATKKSMDIIATPSIGSVRDVSYGAALFKGQLAVRMWGSLRRSHMATRRCRTWQRSFRRCLERSRAGRGRASFHRGVALRQSLGASQDYIVDALTDELTTSISRIPGTFVIARNTASTFKGKPVDTKAIGKDWAYAMCWMVRCNPAPPK